MTMTQSSSFPQSQDAQNRSSQTREPLAVSHTSSPSHQSLLEPLLMSWIDGIMILTEKGQQIHTNTIAQQICDRLSPTKCNSRHVPKDIWNACELLMENHPETLEVAESELHVSNHDVFRVRVRWFELNHAPHLLVILEDRYQSIKNMAIAEINRYRMTPRQAEVWLRYRTQKSLQAIAKELYISVNTVKKHLRTIREKQQDILAQEEIHAYLHLT